MVAGPLDFCGLYLKVSTGVDGFSKPPVLFPRIEEEKKGGGGRS